MASSSLRYKDRLEGAINFSPWKEWINIVLLVNGLWECVDKEILIASNATLAIEHKTKDAKAMGIILDGVKDHTIPHITGKDTAHKMWLALMKLFQSDN